MSIVWPILLLSVLFCCPPAHADIPTVNAMGEYRMGAYDSRSDAQRLAFLQAKWLLLDQVAASLHDVPIIKQRGFTREELRAYLPGILQIVEHPLQTDRDGAAEKASVQATAVIDPVEILRQLEPVLADERAKVGLMQSRDKLDTYRKELDGYTQRLHTNTDPSSLHTLLEYRRETLVLIESEEQVARNWVELARGLGLPAPGTAKEDHHPKSSRSESAGTNGPGNAEEHRKLGAALNDQGKYDEALREFRLALQLMPTLTRAHLGLGAALQGKGDLEGAVAEYRKLLLQRPDDPDAHNNLGTVLQRKGDLTGAIAEYRAALHEHPDDALIHFNLGTALSVKGTDDEAVTEYQTVVRLRPDFASAYFYLGTLYKQKRQMREAAEAFRSYLKVAPHTPENQRWIEEAQHFLLEKDQRRDRHDR